MVQTKTKFSYCSAVKAVVLLFFKLPDNSVQFPFRRKVCKIGILKYPLSLSPLGFKINFGYHKIEISYCLCKLPGHQV